MFLLWLTWCITLWLSVDLSAQAGLGVSLVMQHISICNDWSIMPDCCTLAWTFPSQTHGNTFRKGWSKSVSFQESPDENLSSPKQNISAQLRFATFHLNEPRESRNNVIWTESLKMLGHMHSAMVDEKQTWHFRTNFLQYEGGSVMIRVTKIGVISSACQSFVESNLRSSVQQLKL